MLLAVTIWLITLITAVLFAGRYWWFPEVASQHGAALDAQFVRTLVVTGVVFLAAQLGLGYAIVRYRAREGTTAVYSHGNNRLEVLWTVLTAVIFFAMVIPGQRLFATLYQPGEESQRLLQIEVTGQQFQWNFRYPGPDGRFGRVRPELINDISNPVGLDPEDPAGEDDIVLPTMAIPVNRPVELLLRAKDVTHSFFVRELRLKQDTVPGMVVPIYFKATRTGTFEIACAELCGLGHHRMRSFLSILSEQEFQEWLQENSGS